MSAGRITPVILCGGAGARLWPLSRRDTPKQMLALTGAETMLRRTAARVGAPDLFAPPLVVGASSQADAIAGEIGSEAKLILEPAARNTAPAIAIAALVAAPEAVLLVLPSDHEIADTDGFRSAVERALPLADVGTSAAVS